MNSYPAYHGSTAQPHCQVATSWSVRLQWASRRVASKVACCRAAGGATRRAKKRDDEQKQLMSNIGNNTSEGDEGCRELYPKTEIEVRSWRRTRLLINGSVNCLNRGLPCTGYCPSICPPLPHHHRPPPKSPFFWADVQRSSNHTYICIFTRYATS